MTEKPQKEKDVNLFFSHPYWVSGAMFSIGYIFVSHAEEVMQIPIWIRFVLLFGIYFMWPLILGVEFAGQH